MFKIILAWQKRIARVAATMLPLGDNSKKVGYAREDGRSYRRVSAETGLCLITYWFIFIVVITERQHRN